MRADIAAHRHLYRQELSGVLRVTARQVPADTEPIAVSEYDADLEKWLPGTTSVNVTDSGPLGGPALSMALNRYLEPPRHEFPWSAALFAMRLECRRSHPGHTEREPFHGSLCWRLAYLLIVASLDPTQVADELGIPTQHVLDRWESVGKWMLGDMEARERRTREPLPSEDPTPTRLSLLVCDAAHRQVRDFDLEQRIWESQMRLHPELGLVAWEVEWARRLEEQGEHRAGSERCRRMAA